MFVLQSIGKVYIQKSFTKCTYQKPISLRAGHNGEFNADYERIKIIINAWACGLDKPHAQAMGYLSTTNSMP